MNDIERIKNDILKQVYSRFEEFFQFYLEDEEDNYISPSDFYITLSPSDYSILKEALYGR